MALEHSEVAIQISGGTDPGMVRSNNEDAIDWWSECRLAILADGMGGHNAGEVASRLAVETVRTALAASVCTHGDNIGEALRAAVTAANSVVFDHAQSQPGCKGMGTTLVVTHVDGDTLHAANVGDSRLYRWRSGELKQVSRDHSLVADMVARGFMSPEEARTSPQKNIITRAVGLSAKVEVDIFTETVSAGDLWLLCSDGLSDVVDDATLASVLGEHAATPGALPGLLLQLARAGGGPDNISVVLMAIQNSVNGGS